MAYVQDDNGRWVRTTRCSYCTGVGHNKRACPQLKARAAENPDGYAAGMLKRSKVTCGWCKTKGHNARTCPDKKGAKTKLKELEPLFKQHCIRCHNAATKKGDVRLDKVRLDFVRERELWDKVEQMIDSNEMPPKKPFLTDSQRVKITDWINTQKDKVDWSAHR